MALGHLNEFELAFLCRHLDAALGLQGDVAEFGVYQGYTALQIALRLPPGKRMHLFDSFRGLPPLDPENDWGTALEGREGQYASPRSVTEQIFREAGVACEIYEGWFADTLRAFAGPLCFAHLDCDLYRSTLDVFAHAGRVFPKGARIVAHDYKGNWGCAGMDRAIDPILASGTWELLEHNPNGPGQAALGKR
jgi:hypothetical protein